MASSPGGKNSKDTVTALDIVFTPERAPYSTISMQAPKL
jgi:hypothetical protein